MGLSQGWRVVNPRVVGGQPRQRAQVVAASRQSRALECAFGADSLRLCGTCKPDYLATGPLPPPPPTAWLEDGEWTAAMHERWSHPAVASLVDSAITSFGNDK